VKPNEQPVLSLSDLVVEFQTPSGLVRAIDGLSLDIFPNEVLAIVGESGSGKSVTALAVMGLLPATARITSGIVEFRGREITHLSFPERAGLLGREMSIIFQDPMSSLNPVMKIGRQIAEMIRQHESGLSRKAVRARVVELLEMVRIPNAAGRYGSYPHEFSGGMRQRVMIAMAVAHSPALLMADEPTTALDVTIQAQILRVLSQVRGDTGASMALITHDLGLVAEYADRVVVMYAGRVMETAPVEEIFQNPRHPYTVGLLASSLRLDTSADVAYAIPGQPPQLNRRPTGCVFHPRCGLSGGRAACRTDIPALQAVESGRSHLSACHFAGEVPGWQAADAQLSETLEKPVTSE
jgi:peptide/nickel transport system ATP-binding protein